MPISAEVLSPVIDHVWKPFRSFVRGDVFRESDAAALPYGKHEQLRAWGFLKDFPPPPITKPNAPPVVAESDEHLSARLGLEAVIENFAAAHSVERSLVREGLEADAEQIDLPRVTWVRNDEGVPIALEQPSGSVIAIPREVRATYKALMRELQKIEKKEAAK